MNKTLITTIFILFFSLYSYAGSLIQQQDVKTIRNQELLDLSLITGYQTGSSNSNFIEIGLGIKKETWNHHPAHGVVRFSNELLFADKFVWGVKVGANFGTGMMDLGVNLINYTNFEENSIRFRPEFGLGFGRFRLYYGYNLPITNKNFLDVNDHLIGINLLFDLKDLQKPVEVMDVQPQE